MTPVTPSLVFCKVSIVYTSILILQTCLLLMLLPTLVISIMLSVTKVLHLTTQVCSIAHMFPSRWFVPLERTPSSPRLDSRLVMVLFPTHLQKELLRVSEDSVSTATVTTEELLSRTSCDSYSQELSGGSNRTLFFYAKYLKISQRNALPY